MTTTTCPASGTPSQTWPGREAVCPLCLTAVTVRRDGTLRLHRLSRRKAAVAARRYTLLRVLGGTGLLTDKWGNPVNEDGEPIGVTNEEGWAD